MLKEAQKEKIHEYFKRISKLPEFKSEEKIRQERRALVDFLRTPEGIEQMTQIELGKLISNLWSYNTWANKDYVVERIWTEPPKLKEYLKMLLHDNEKPFEERFNNFIKNVKHLGPASITEILCLYDPTRYGIWNDRSRKALRILGFDDLPLKKYYITGKEYTRINEVFKQIAKELQRLGHEGADLITVDLFLWLVWKESEKIEKEEEPEEMKDFDHNEVRDYIKDIGEWLGFEATTEVMVAKGARVDVIWRVKVANLGVITYVFEVHRKGSIDSLLLNLQKATNNPTVQKVIAVSDKRQLEKIKDEVEALPENFRKMMGYWDVSDVITVHEKLADVIESLARLELVKGQFD